jgi:hypothetical protein
MKIDRHKGHTGGITVDTAAGAWTYTDPAVHERVVELVRKGIVNVASIDDWIEGENWPAPDQLTRVLEWRQRILDATDDDAAEGWGMFMSTLVAFNARERFLHPLALIGQQVGPKLAPPGEQRTIYTPKGRTAVRQSSRDKRILAATKRGLSIESIAKAEGVSPSTVSRVRRLGK